MQFKVLAACLGLFLTFSPAAWSKQTINVVVDPWAPFGGEDLRNGGITLDVVRTVLIRAGYRVATHIVPWERAMDGTQRGQYDVLGHLFYLPELEEFVTYSDPFYESEVRFVRRRGTGLKYTGLESLAPYTIAVGAGYLYDPEFDRAEYLRKTEVTSTVQGLRMVAGGRADLTLDSIEVLNYVIAREAPELASQLEVLDNRLAVQPLHMAVRNDLPGRDELIREFNRVLAGMRADGSLEELIARHQY